MAITTGGDACGAAAGPEPRGDSSPRAVAADETLG